jgi:DNA invertase Pin-like site-specific DNA recombinase
MTSGDKVVGYVRVSTADQGASGYSIDAQATLIESECRRRGWTLIEVFKDVASAATTKKRPGYDRALSACEHGDAQGIVAAKLNRISRSVLDFGALLQRARGKRFNVCVLDLDLDLSTPMGEAMANMAVTFAQLERRLIGQRTVTAMAMAKKKGVHCGRPRILPAKVVDNIKRQRAQGKTLQAIASALNDKGIQTAHNGRKWYPSTVQSGSALRVTSEPTARPGSCRRDSPPSHADQCGPMPDLPPGGEEWHGYPVRTQELQPILEPGVQS